MGFDENRGAADQPDEESRVRDFIPTEHAATFPVCRTSNT